jgi:hypothetical protein
MKVILRRFLVSFAGALILLSCASCSTLRPPSAWQPPRPVAIKGGPFMWANLTDPGVIWPAAAELGGTGGLLLQDGDIVSGYAASDREGSDQGQCFFVYRQCDGASVELRPENGRLLLSGKTISIDPADIESRWEWLDQASAKDLRSLRFLMLPEIVEESRLPALRKLAAVNPTIGLGIWSTSSSLSAAALFKPRMVALGAPDVPAAEFGRFLAGQGQLESLFLMGGIDAENLEVLATLPNLRRLAVFEWDPARTGPLPRGMRALKSLLLPGSNNLDASALANAPDGLEELSIEESNGQSDTMKRLGGLERFSNLRALFLVGNSEIEDLSALKGMKKLAWISLPPGITQEQLSGFVEEHPALEIVVMIGCREITDLSPLQGLAGLKGLVLGQYAGTLDAVEHLKSLEFLGLPNTVFDDTKSLARIREALPRALVVPACLGSGWILLLIPLAALVWIARSRARGRRRTVPQGAHR